MVSARADRWHLKYGDKLGVHVSRLAVRESLAGSGDDNGPNEARIIVRSLVEQRPVQPQLRADSLQGARARL